MAAGEFARQAVAGVSWLVTSVGWIAKIGAIIGLMVAAQNLIFKGVGNMMTLVGGVDMSRYENGSIPSPNRYALLWTDKGNGITSVLIFIITVIALVVQAAIHCCCPKPGRANKSVQTEALPGDGHDQASQVAAHQAVPEEQPDQTRSNDQNQIPSTLVKVEVHSEYNILNEDMEIEKTPLLPPEDDEDPELQWQLCKEF